MPDDQSPQPDVPQTNEPTNDVPQFGAPQSNEPAQPQQTPTFDTPAQPEVSAEPQPATFGAEQPPVSSPEQPGTANVEQPAANPFAQPVAPQADAPQSPDTSSNVFGQSGPAPVTPTPGPQGTPGKQRMILLIVGIVLGLAVLIGGGVALALTLGNGDNTKNASQNKDDNTGPVGDTQSEDQLRAANAKVAERMSDMSTVCDTGSITNAAAFAKPYKVVAFEKEDGRNSWSMQSLQSDAAYSVDYDDYAKANVVVCLTENVSARVKSMTCDFKSGDEKISVDYYATSYDAVAYEAQSGKKIEDLGSAGAPASRCPMFATYNKNDPKIIASPDSAAVNSLVAKFAN